MLHCEQIASWAQILRLDGAKADWQVDLEMPLHLRAEVLYAATFTTESNEDSRARSPRA